METIIIARVANKSNETSRTQQSLLHITKPNVPHVQIELIRICKEGTGARNGQEDCTVKLSSHGCRLIGQRGAGGGAARNQLQVKTLQLFVVDLIRFGNFGVGSDIRGVTMMHCKYECFM